METGVERGLKQVQERFPTGSDYPPSDYDFTAIINAITNDLDLIQRNIPSDDTKAILVKFKGFSAKDC